MTHPAHKLSPQAKHVLCRECGYQGHFTAPKNETDRLKALVELQAAGYGGIDEKDTFLETDAAHHAAEALLFNH